MTINRKIAPDSGPTEPTKTVGQTISNQHPARRDDGLGWQKYYFLTA